MPDLRLCMHEQEGVLWEVLARWHKELQDRRGDRASLRKAKTVVEVLFAPAYHRGLVQALRDKGVTLGTRDLERLALPVGILAHAKRLTAQPHVARLLAQAERQDERMRDVRFRRLMLISDSDADRDRLYTACLRLVRYLDGVLEPRSFVTGTFYWNDLAKKEWAKNYYLGGAEALTA